MPDILSPFALESYGRRGNQQTFMKEIANELFKKQLSTEDSKLEAQLLNRWWIELSYTLHKGEQVSSSLDHLVFWKVNMYLKKSNMC